MSFQINYYGIRDKKCFPVEHKDAAWLNENKTDIYWTPNNFSAFGKRKKEDLTEITSFFCEIDAGDKIGQIMKLATHLTPSMVIETKRGLHCYWYLKTVIDCRKEAVARADWFREILKNRICPALDADTQAADASRLLRVPFFKYWKDGLGEFVCDIAFETNRLYTVEEVLSAFPDRTQLPEPHHAHQDATGSTIDIMNGFWASANQIDSMAGLLRLSGTSHVCMETFTFKRKGKLTRILINNKASNAWIDENGKIGSTAEGGPSLPNWLYYYHKDWKKVAEIMKEVFPELKDKK